MPNEVNIYSPRYLAEVVRQAPPVHTYFRDTFFSNVRTFPTERVDIDLVKGDRRMAAFVHPRIGGQVLKGTGYKTESYRDRLRRRAFRLVGRYQREIFYRQGNTPVYPQRRIYHAD